MTAIKSLFQNYIFISTFTSLCVAQVTKMIVYLLTNQKKIKSKNKWEVVETMIWRTGGMPSSHSALVCCLVTSTGLKEGFSSTYFIFSLVFALVVLRDAMGVRRAAGIQAKALNNLGKQSAEKNGLEFNSVKEIQGHTPFEVIVGALLGILIAVVFYLI